MGRTVKVEGNFAATTTSAHVAKTEGADIRIKGKDKVERKNWIETDHLSKDRTTNTKFDKGWVWKADSWCGLPPPSHDQPADSLPGAFNGLLVNQYAEAQAGQGAQSVFVEGQKVIRWDDKTHQNKRNSKGKIINAEDLAAYLAEPLKPDPAPPAPKPKVPTKPTAPVAGNQGTTTPQGGKKENPRLTTQGTDPTKDCQLTRASMSGPKDARIQSDDPAAATPGQIWLLDNHSVKVVSTVTKCCDKHPKVTFGSESKVGPDVGFSMSNVNIARALETAIITTLIPGSGVIPPRPVQTALTVQSCKTQFNRTVWAMSRQVAQISFGNPAGKWPAATALLQKIPLIGKRIDDVKVFEGGIEFKLEWKEEDWWGGSLTVQSSGTLTIIQIKINGFKYNLFTLLGPGAAIIVVLQELASALDVPIEANIVMTITGQLQAKADVKFKLIRGVELSAASGNITGQVNLIFFLGLELKGAKLFEATGGIEGTFSLFAESKLSKLPTMSFDFLYQAKLTAKVEVKIGLGKWFQVKGKREYPFLDSGKQPLSTFDLLNLSQASPAGA